MLAIRCNIWALGPYDARNNWALRAHEALGCSGLFVALAVGVSPSARAQLAMWLVIPVWMGVLSGCYFFTSGLRAWGWLVASNLVVLGLLAALRGG